MAKEYRKKGRAKSAGSSARQFLLVLFSFVCGYLSASLVNFAQVSTWVKSQILAHTEQVTTASVNKSAHHQIPKPKFEFYTLLANEAGSTSTSAQSSPSDPVTNASNVMSNTAVKSMTLAKSPSLPPVTSPTATVVAPAKDKSAHLSTTMASKAAFSVQIASFNRKDDAEKMKAALILKGFNVSLAVVNQQGINWYRVVIGPYASRLLAEKASSSLGIRGMIRRV
jgi:cell division protein FtsN